MLLAAVPALGGSGIQYEKDRTFKLWIFFVRISLVFIAIVLLVPNLGAAADQRTPVRLDQFGDPLPDEALARFGTVRFGSSLPHSITFSPDGAKIAAADGGSPVIWDVATGKRLFRFDGDEGGIRPCFRVTYSPDGKMLAATRLNEVQLWNTRTGELIRELKGHTFPPICLVFTSDGNTVISGGNDNTIRFWDVATGRETAKLEAPANSVYALALSSDGKQLASGGFQTIRLWNAATRELLKEFRVERLINNLSFSADGRQLVGSGSPWSQCIVWDTTKGEPVRELDKENRAVNTASFSPDRKWLAAGCEDGTIRLYDPATGKEVRRWETQDTAVHSLIFSSDSKVVASGSNWQCGVRFWDVEAGKEIRPLSVHRSAIQDIRLSTDGKSLWSRGSGDHRVIRWNAATAELAEVVAIPSKVPYRSEGALSADGAFLAWGAASDKTVHVMDLKTQKDACQPLKIEVGAPMAGSNTDAMSVQFSPDGKDLAVGCNQRLFYVWKWQTQRDPKPVKAPEGDKITAQLFTPDGKLITGTIFGAYDLLHVWDVAAGKELLSFKGNGYGLAVSPNGKWRVSNWGPRPGGLIRVFDFEKGKLVREIKVEPGGGAVLAFSPDGRIIASDEHFHVKLIEFATGQTIATFKGHLSSVNALRFASDGRTLYTGGCDSTILKWDATGRHGNAQSTPTLEAAWQALAQEATKAYPASWDLVDEPKQAIEFLRQRIKPAKKLDIKDIQPMVDMLDSDKFGARQKATEDLQALVYSAEPVVRKLLESEQLPEVKQRLKAVLDRLTGDEFVRIRRALDVLQTINNGAAKRLLRELAAGAPGNMLTSEAISRVDRLTPR
jgi:WD40 repeat protein